MRSETTVADDLVFTMTRQMGSGKERPNVRTLQLAREHVDSAAAGPKRAGGSRELGAGSWGEGLGAAGWRAGEGLREAGTPTS